MFRTNDGETLPVITPFVQRAQKIIDKRDKADATARQLIGQYRTTEALAKDVPELAKFMPALSAGGMLPAITVSNALADLMQQGVDFKEEVAA